MFNSDAYFFDVASFFNDNGLKYKVVEGGRGDQLVSDCPVCFGVKKLWSSFQGNLHYCHRCAWSPGSLEDFVSKFFCLNPFQVDLLVEKYFFLRKSNSGSSQVDKVIVDLSQYQKQKGDGNISSVSCDNFLKMVPDDIFIPEVNLQWPDFYLPLGDSKIETINRYAESRGFSMDLLSSLKFGGCGHGKYYGSLIVPAVNKGKLMFWQARDCLNRPKPFPKYRTPLGYKSRYALFNLDSAVCFDEVVICEGVFSALRVGRDAVGTFGNKVTKEQAYLLKEAGVKNVVLCFDSDTWTVPQPILDRGVKGMKPPIVNAVIRLLANFERVRVVKLDAGDPDDLGGVVMRNLIKQAPVLTDRSELFKLFF